MDAALLAQIGAETAANPQGAGAVPILQSRVLLADGDGLAYAASGTDDTPIGAARRKLLDKVAAAASIAGAGASKILLTGQSSPKGFRYAVARVKPYQGQRKENRRPKNWAGLRAAMEGGSIPNVDLTTTVEADDLFGKWATNLGPENTVIYTEDKDMRMVPGWHLDWSAHTMHFVPEGTWELVYNDKVFGRKWFWLQMLQGDSVDNIPGLPFSDPAGGRGNLVGPKTAEKFLTNVQSDEHAFNEVRHWYMQYYGDAWLVQMLEQGILLWMRRDEYSTWYDVTMPGNPLVYLRSYAAFDTAMTEMKDRIRESL